MGRFLEPPLYIDVIMALLRSIGISLSEKLYTAVGEGGLGSYCIVSEELLKIHLRLKKSFAR